MTTPKITYYGNFERCDFELKIPKFTLTKYAGNYPPFEMLRNKIGGIDLRLNSKGQGNGNRKDTPSTPDLYLQGKNGLNITGLYHFWQNGKISGFCCGNPPKERFCCGKKHFLNPFW